MKMKENKKYDGFAIASFVLALIIVIWPYTMPGFQFMRWASLLSLIFGVTSLVRIKKNKNSRGKVLAIFGIIISALEKILIIIDKVILGRVI